MKVTKSVVGQRSTTARLVAAIERRHLTVFARFDHTELAQQVGLELTPIEVIVFGNPRAGTPLMVRDPRVGIELPLRFLVWEDGESPALIGYHDPRDLADRYELDDQLVVLDTMAELLAAIAAEAAAPEEVVEPEA
ncbi:MAG TPA: DUF302 domain-containing protein [Pseudonocardiaceae bacterium]|jgi:uncharacterized protein (DUF302 family)|nr:DUF302 domain-containing protein [Pseudonocardiaceae bacterium]